MKTLTIDVYGFDELSETAKKNARNWYRSATSGDNDWRAAYEHYHCDEAVDEIMVANEYGFTKEGNHIRTS